MKNFKRYYSFKSLIRSSYEIYLKSCQDSISYYKTLNLHLFDVIKYYEALLKSNNIDFVPFVVLEVFDV